MKIVCLGNEFVKEDCFAKEVGKLLTDEFEVVNVNDSFELIGIVDDGGDFILLDVVLGLDRVQIIKIEDLNVNSISSAHDFDAAYILKLIGVDVKIIGIPMSGDADEIASLVERKIKNFTGRTSSP